MAKANSVEAEIDEIIYVWGVDHRRGKFSNGNEATRVLRRQILSVMKKKTLELPHKSGKLGIAVILTHDFWQALKNSRRDGDESKNRV